MTIDEDILHDVQQSLGRCAAHSLFFERFAANFKAARIPLPPVMGQQAKLLREDLVKLVLSAADENFARRPGAVALNIPPQLTKFWIDALMMTVREFDGKFTPELERKWRTLLQRGLATPSDFRLPA